MYLPFLKPGFKGSLSFSSLQRELKRKDEELKRKEQELRRLRGRSVVSEEDEEVLLKRIKMTEEAHRAERDKSNNLEDVSCFANALQSQHVTVLLHATHTQEKIKLIAELSVLRDHRPQMVYNFANKKVPCESLGAWCMCLCSDSRGDS